MAVPVVEELIELENGVVMYDALLQREVLVIAPVLAVLSDNPRHSELLNRSGESAKKFCRMCMVDKDVNPCEVSQPRTKAISTAQINDIRLQTTQAEKTRRKKEYGLRDCPNPLFKLSVDLFRSTPVEVLHTILLGPYKYLLKTTIPQLTPQQKKEVLSRMSTFSYSGFKGRVIGNIIYHHKSFVGRDYKAWAQMALCIIGPYLQESQKIVWVALGKVFRIVYCLPLRTCARREYEELCQAFVDSARDHCPELLRKVKVHLILHLVDCMVAFGPCAAYNTESPAGLGLRELYCFAQVQSFLNGTAAKELYKEKSIHQPGILRKKHGTCTLGCAKVQASGHTESLAQLSMSCTLELSRDLNLETVGTDFGGLISRDKALVKTGDYIKFSTSTEDNYGELLFCGEVESCTFCDFQHLGVTNEYDCPLLTLSSVIHCIHPCSVVSSVSINHECTDTCHFVEQENLCTIEREDISKSSLVYIHDWENELFSLNIYCIRH